MIFMYKDGLRICYVWVRVDCMGVEIGMAYHGNAGKRSGASCSSQQRIEVAIRVE